MTSTRKFNDTQTKIFTVLHSIKSASELAPKGQSILIHPKSEWLRGIHIIELDNIFLKLEKDYKVIKISKISELSPRYKTFLEINLEGPTREFSESYEIDLRKGFESLFERIKMETSVKIQENKKPQMIPKKEEKSADNLLWITYSDKTREILLNNLFILSKPNFNSTNDLVFSYLYRNPNKIVTKKELEREATTSPITKRLHDIVQELGFKKDLNKAFLSVSKTQMTFRNPLTEQDLIDLDLPKIRL